MKSTLLTCSTLMALAACTVDKSPATADTAASNPSAAATADNSSQNAPTVNPTAPPVESTATPSPHPVPIAPSPAGPLVVNAAGIGPVKAGMTVKEANAALGNTLAIPAKLQECDYIRPKSTPKHLAFMVEKGEISRVEIQEGSDLATAEGAKIGDTEDRLKSLYPGIAVNPSKYAGGHSLVVTPKNGGNNRIVFETDGKKVLKYRSGRLPAVEYVEGCG